MEYYKVCFCRLCELTKLKKKTFFKVFSEDDLKNALGDIRNERYSIRQAERQYNSPHSTLINKLKGATPETRKMGPQSVPTEL